MSSDFSETGNSPNFCLQDEVNDFNATDAGHSEASVDTDYNNCFRMNPATKPFISVARRNERERKRVRLVNQGFAILRDRIPRDRCNRGRRSSKVETLRAAIMYIRQLQQLLMESQMRYQEQEMASCYTYVSDDLYLNSVPSVCDNYVLNNGYQIQSYSHLKSNTNIQHANQVCDRHLGLPWFT